MNEKGTYIRFEELPLEVSGSGSPMKDVVSSPGCQVTYIEQNEGAGHGFHQHDDVDEVLIFLEGHCNLGLGDAELDVRGGSLAYAPRGVPHKVRYLAKSKVIRIKFPNPQPC
jgi:quercetin dioxygenase-like cupin family protein